MTRLHLRLSVALGLLVLTSLGCGGSEPASEGDDDESTDPSTPDDTDRPRADGDAASSSEDDDEDDEGPPVGRVPTDGGALDGGRPALDGSADAAKTASDAAARADASSSEDAGRTDAAARQDASTSPEKDGGTTPRPTGKFIGNITTRGRVRDDFTMFWNQLTPENEGKWGSVERIRNEMDWSGLDRAYAYARERGILFKHHTLVWGSQQPEWLKGLPANQQRAEVEEWIRLLCERYPDAELIDVVNEPPPHTNPVYAQALGGAGASGYDWIVQSFKWARQYCPKAVLILNDFNTIEYTADANRFIDIVKRVKAAGAPIDAVGAQAHDAYKIPTNTVKQFLDRLAAETGLPVYISEYDINEANETRQAEIMKSQFTMFWTHPAVKGVTLWGYVSGATWLPNTGLMSESGQQREAMRWLLGYLKQ